MILLLMLLLYSIHLDPFEVLILSDYSIMLKMLIMSKTLKLLLFFT